MNQDKARLLSDLWADTVCLSKINTAQAHNTYWGYNPICMTAHFHVSNIRKRYLFTFRTSQSCKSEVNTFVTEQF